MTFLKDSFDNDNPLMHFYSGETVLIHEIYFEYNRYLITFTQ